MLSDMKNLLLFVLIFAGIDLNIACADEADKWYEQSFSELLSTKTVTATRSDKTLADTPSNLSVYTADDLERMGIRTLKELLQRTPGFFTGKQVSGPMIGSRGFMGDNEQFLLLIDGHNANSIVGQGAGHTFMFPFLEHIDRVEILKGPGSTLWGSDAALGIIHLITKDGAGIDGHKLTVSKSSEDNMAYGNIQVGEQLYPDVDMMASLSYAKSDGYIIDDSQLLFDNPGRWELLHDSWELYTKAQIKNYAVYARVTDMKNVRPQRSLGYGVDDAALQRRRHFYVDIARDYTLSDTLVIEGRVFSDLIERWQELLIPLTTPALRSPERSAEESYSSREHSLGLEAIGKWQANENHHVLFGYRGVRTEIDPVPGVVKYPLSNEVGSTPASLAMRVIPEAADKNNAVFVEDDWQITPTLNLITGVRVDKNSLREDNVIVLPRLATVWTFAPAWRLKYSYNTGYIRPPVGIGFLGQSQQGVYVDPTTLTAENITLYGASQSEEVINNELQLVFNSPELSWGISAYHMRIDNAFNFLFKSDEVDDEIRTLFYINTAPIETYGYELEFTYSPGVISLYGNFSQVLSAKVDSQTGSYAGVDYDLSQADIFNASGPLASLFDGENTVSGYPHLAWNLGVDYAFMRTMMLNVHYRGWDKAYFQDQIKGSGSVAYGAEHMVDINLRYQNIGGSNVDASIFIKNALDNEGEAPQLYFFYTWKPLGRSIGGKLSYRF